MRYLDSKFKGHATANDLLTNFSDEIKNVGGGNHMIQVSVDQSSTKWKFFEMLQKGRTEKGQHELTNFGSCSLHVIHSAFKTGVERSRWSIKAWMY